MASSQVGIAVTSPFGCVLRKYSHRQTGRFQKKVTNFVNDHLNNNNNTSGGGSVSSDDEKNTRNTPNDRIDNVRQLTRCNSERDEPCQWAARKAREMVSTIETEAELLETLPNMEKPGVSTSSEISKASSLVRIWEKRLSKSNSVGSISDDLLPTSDWGPERAGAISHESDCSTPGARSSNNNDNIEWDGNNNRTERERVRVADIVKKLKNEQQDHQQQQYYNNNNNNNNNNSTMVGGSSSLSRLRVGVPTPTSEQGSENHIKSIVNVASSPRIRGRQAFNDLLMQIERDRHGELNNLSRRAVVSKFPQKGRIQAHLRLKLLQRRQAAASSRHESTSQVNKKPQGSTITHLRERFSIKVEHGNTFQTEVACPRTPHPRHLIRDSCTHSHIVHGNGNHNSHPVEACAEKLVSHSMEESHASSSETRLEAQTVVVRQEIAEPSSSPCCNRVESNANDETDNKAKAEAEAEAEAEAKQEEHNAVSVEAQSSNVIEIETIEEENASEQQRYDEEGGEQPYDYENNYYDWISHIARPRSYWEDRRQAWYKEMLDAATSDKGEIRQLLERRTVSTFLSSDFRVRMDKLMESHVGTQTLFVNSQEDEEDQLMAFLQQHLARNLEENEGGRQEEEEEEGQGDVEKEEKAEAEEEDEEEEKEEERSLINGPCNNEEASEYFNQSSPSTHLLNSTASPDLSRWSYRDNIEASDDSDRVESTASTQPSQSQTFYQDSQQYSSSTTRNSIEMDIVYDLKGQIEQLHQEMSEMRKALKSCLDMQVLLQQSMKQDVKTVKEKKKSLDHRGPKKGNCCICYEKKVDSVLYRCGHMCACLKCANELQWNSRKCPICRAQIVDVVRVFVDA